MNNWQAMGYIFLGFGLVLFIFGIFEGLQAAYSTSLAISMQKAFFDAIVPWLLPASFCWVIAIVSVVMGTKQNSP